MNRIFFLIIAVSLYLLLDYYVFQAIKLAAGELSPGWKRGITIGYFAVSLGLLLGVGLYTTLDPEVFGNFRLFLATSFFVVLVGKLFASVFLVLDDFRRLIGFVFNLLPFGSDDEGMNTSRAEFMAKTSLIASTLPIAALSFGVISGAHDYRVRRRTLTFKSLPKAFDGIRIAQLSDIHTGSFFNKTAVSGGVDLLLAEKPDVVFFTGDLVNDQSDEAKPYLDIFKKVKAPMGVYSTMGNHDYGDYRSWPSIQDKQRDIANLQQMHRYMGWDILLNEHRFLSEGGEQMAILGLENWGKGRFSKYGNMARTVKGTEETPFQILLSHDPSHWDAQVRPEYPEVDLMLAGHTHGMQFGIEIGDFRWSPSSLAYKQWADLYQEGEQYLYVNRGFGFIGYPGRVGILPEITILELKTS